MSKQKSEKKKHPIIIVVSVLVVLILASQALYITAENEYTVVKQFGRITTTNDSAGLRVKIPFIHSISSVPKATQLYDMPVSEVFTSDKKSMTEDAYILWKVTDAKKFTSSLNASISAAEGRLDIIVYNAIKNNISAMTQDELIASRDCAIQTNATEAELDDVEIKDMSTATSSAVDGEEAKENTDKDVSEYDISENENGVTVIAFSERLLDTIGEQCAEYGIEITDVKIKVLDLPEENKAAVYERMITERNNIAAAYTAQGASEAQVIKNTTNAEVKVLKSEAQAEADQIEAEGEAEYMRVMKKAYNSQDKADFYLFSLSLDAAKAPLKNGNTTLFLDKDSPIAKIFENVE